MTTHNPSSPCACYIEHGTQLINTVAYSTERIVYCEKHASINAVLAERDQLREALQGLLNAIDLYPRMISQMPAQISKARAALNGGK